jgi:hypothetical protein
VKDGDSSSKLSKWMGLLGIKRGSLLEGFHWYEVLKLFWAKTLN